MDTLTTAAALVAAPSAKPRSPHRSGTTEREVKHTRHVGMLDGMRGLAAFAVLLRHVEFAAGLSRKGVPLLPHAYLAVDFFYMLSGFVIAMAYERKLLSSLSVPKFLVQRAIRLYPMIFAGALLGALSLLLHKLVSSDFSLRQVLSASLSGFLVLPSDALMPRNDQKFPANVPEWSLFFELLANVAYALILRWLTTRRLLGLCALAACGLSISAACTRDLDGGWSHSTFWLGFVRVSFAFFMGILLHRMPARVSFGLRTNAILAVLLSLILLSPFFQDSWLLDLGTILFCFPVIVWCGAACTSYGTLNRIWLSVGAISYPLYITHNPLLRMVANLFRMGHIHSAALLAIALLTASVAFAWALVRIYDEPSRVWLQAAVQRLMRS